MPGISLKAVRHHQDIWVKIKREDCWEGHLHLALNHIDNHLQHHQLLKVAVQKTQMCIVIQWEGVWRSVNQYGL